MAQLQDVMAMLLLGAPAELSSEAVFALAEEALPAATVERAEAPPGYPGLTLLRINGVHYVWRHHPNPTPPGHLDRAVSAPRSWSFPEASQVLPYHRAHVVIAPLKPPNTLGSHLFAAQTITRLAAAVAEQHSLLGLYWAGADAVSRGTRVARTPAQLDADLPPIDLWVGFDLFTGNAGEPDDDLVGLGTVGFSQFCPFELELDPASPSIRGAARDGIDVVVEVMLQRLCEVSHGDVFSTGDKRSYWLEIPDGPDPGPSASPIYFLRYMKGEG